MRAAWEGRRERRENELVDVLPSFGKKGCACMTTEA